MEQHDFSEGLEIADSFAIDTIPMLGVALFTFRAFRLSLDGKQPQPRELEAIGMPLQVLRELQSSLPALIAEMVRLGAQKTGSPPPANH